MSGVEAEAEREAGAREERALGELAAVEARAMMTFKELQARVRQTEPKLMIYKFSWIERLRLLRRGWWRLAWTGFQFYCDYPGFKWRNPAEKRPTPIVGQILYSGQLVIPKPEFKPTLTRESIEDEPGARDPYSE